MRRNSVTNYVSYWIAVKIIMVAGFETFTVYRFDLLID